MGKKKTAHVQQSMGQMVSRAAIAQLGPEIERVIRAYIKDLGGNLAKQQAATLETVFSRVIVLENIVMEKLGITKDDLTTRVSDIEDSKDGLSSVTGPVELNDVVRLEVSTKTKDQTEYQGTSRIKMYKTGSGETIGSELETPLLGMNPGDTKEISFGKDGEMVAKLTINRISRAPSKPQEPANPVPETPLNNEAPNADQAQG